MADNLFTALWKRHAQHAATWRALCLGQAVITTLALVLVFTLLHRPREVVRIGCDGIPQLVRLDVQQYSEPNEHEIQAFVRLWAVAYARDDSFISARSAPCASERRLTKTAPGASASRHKPKTIGWTATRTTAAGSRTRTHRAGEWTGCSRRSRESKRNSMAAALTPGSTLETIGGSRQFVHTPPSVLIACMRDRT